MRVFSFILILSLSHVAHAGCPTFFERIKSVFFKPTLTINIPENVKNDLFNFDVSSFPKTKRVTYTNTGSNEFGFLLSKVPPSFIEVIKKTPVNSRHVLELKEKVFAVNSKLKGSILENIFDGLRSHTIGAKEETFEGLINRRLSEFERSSLKEKDRIEGNYSHGLIISKVNKHWESNYKSKLQIISKNGNKVVFKIGERTYSGKIVEKRGGKFVIFKAAKEDFSHPAWNPLDHQYIAKLANDPTFKGKDFYPVSVGHNGRLYLLDGNHRSTLDSRAMLPAEIPYPMYTATLRNHLDLIGRPQPTTEQKIKIMKGELDPYSLLNNRPTY